MMAVILWNYLFPLCTEFHIHENYGHHQIWWWWSPKGISSSFFSFSLSSFECTPLSNNEVDDMDDDDNDVSTDWTLDYHLREMEKFNWREIQLDSDRIQTPKIATDQYD